MQRLAILAGGGSLPLALAASIQRRGDQAHIVGLLGEADKGIEAYPHTWVSLGSVNALLATIRKQSDGVMVIAGVVSRPDLLRLKMDFGIIRYLPQVLSLMKGGDDAVLTRVVRFFEGRGIVVKGVSDVAPELLANEGVLATGLEGSAQERAQTTVDTALGFEVLDLLGDLDVGQAIAVEAGRVLAIEGAEGTDRMLARVAVLRGATAAASDLPRKGMRGVAVKGPKRGQDLRVDLPAVGANTIGRLVEARLGTLVVTSGNTLLLGRQEMIERAKAENIAVHCIKRETEVSARTVGRTMRFAGAAVGRVQAAAADAKDALTAADVTQRLAPYHCGRAAVVVRDHVLAIAAEEGPVAMAERVASLRQWGRGRSARRLGAVAIRLDAAHDDAAEPVALIEALTSAGLAGVVLVRRDVRVAEANELPPRLLAAAEKHGLFLMEAVAADSAPGRGDGTDRGQNK